MRSEISRPDAVILGVTLAAILVLALPKDVSGQPGSEWVPGPTRVQLGNGLAELTVREGYLFADASFTQEIMRDAGNPPSGNELGMLVPASEFENWFLVFEFADVGYVKDDDKDNLDPAAILDSIKNGTEEANKQRAAMGVPALHVVGWLREPQYDSATKNLVWAIEGVEEGTGDRSGNYNVRLLGRKGYTSATLVADVQEVFTLLPEVETALQGFSYVSGSRYADFTSGDQIAKYGLTALIAGGAGAAAAKLGLFAKLGQFLAKAWKVVVVAVFALLGGIKRLFSRKPSGLSDQFPG